jgi:hypothetical protein
MKAYIKLSATNRNTAVCVDLLSVNEITIAEDSRVLCLKNSNRYVYDKKEIKLIDAWIEGNTFTKVT